MGIVAQLESILAPIRPEALFPTAQPLEIELGAGDGGFLVERASQEPQHNFIAVERLLGRLRKIERRATRRGLTNVRAIRIEASYFLQYLTPERSVFALHVYFPDPWPKRKHWRHRLVNEPFPALVARVLVPGGAVYLRTDHAAYYSQMSQVFAAHGAFAPCETPPALMAVPTDFEREFLSSGAEIFRTGFALR